ncbi:MAG: hypothetical protein M1549_04235 [Candidatus Dependentiae bacterium]|nr:hypothetical protein [Candidatus Dependentiae bacterium]
MKLLSLSVSIFTAFCITPALVASRDSADINGSARLRRLVLDELRVRGNIDIYQSTFGSLDAGGFLSLVSTIIKKCLNCQGEVKLSESKCSKVVAAAGLIVLDQSSIDELIIEPVNTGKKTGEPHVILKGGSSIGTVTFRKQTGSIQIKDAASHVGNVTNGTVLP